MSKWINFKQLKGELLFTTVLAHYGILHAGAKTQDMVLCPFHKEKTPSLSLNKDKGVFRCFGCGTQGNVLDFVCEMEDLDPTNSADLAKAAHFAIEKILGKHADDFGRDVKHPKRREKKKKTAKKQEPRKPKDAPNAECEENDEAQSNKVLTFELQNLGPKHPFFDRRGLGRNTVETFGLGFCERGIMKDRIVIPIHSGAGELVAYAGRWPEDEMPEGKSRYRFPKNFQKTLELYNLHRAVELLGETRTMFVVEGFWSAIRLHEAGMPAVAIFGQDVSKAQAELLATHVDRVVLVLDGDEAGRKGTEKGAWRLSQHVDTRSVLLPSGEKPDSTSLDALRALV